MKRSAALELTVAIFVLAATGALVALPLPGE